MELLFVLLAALSLFAIGKVSIPSDPEKGLQRLIELRGKDDLTEDEQSELEALEDRMQDAFNVEEREDGGFTEEDLDKVLNRFMEKTKESDEDTEEEDRDIHNPDDEPEIEVRDSIVKPWHKRTAKWINAGIAKARDEHGKAQKIKKDLVKDVKEMGSRQRNAELKHIKDKAEEVKENAGRLVVCSPGLHNRIQRKAMQGYVRTLTIGTDSEGGTLLPKPFLAEIAVIIEERGIVRNLFRGIPMSSDSLDLDNIATKPSAGWVDEEGLIPESDPAFGDGSLDAKKLGAVTSWSMELQEDSAYAFIPVIAELFGEVILEKEDDAGLIGDGSASHGGFTGLTQLSGAETFTLETGETSLQDATLDDFRDLRDQLSLARRRGAVYVMHPDVESYLEGQKSDDGEYIYRKPADQASPGTLWGHPVVLSESMPNDPAAGEAFVAFGNPVYMLMGMRRTLTATQSTDGILSNASNEVVLNAFQQDAVLWKTTERIAFQAQIESAFAKMETAAS